MLTHQLHTFSTGFSAGFLRISAIFSVNICEGVLGREGWGEDFFLGAEMPPEDDCGLESGLMPC